MRMLVKVPEVETAVKSRVEGEVGTDKFFKAFYKCANIHLPV